LNLSSDNFNLYEDKSIYNSENKTKIKNKSENVSKEDKSNAFVELLNSTNEDDSKKVEQNNKKSNDKNSSKKKYDKIYI